MSIMLLAAGEGTRLRPYTLENPKPAIPFLGIPMAYYSLKMLEEINDQSLVVNTFYLPNKIHQLFNNSLFKKYSVLFSDELNYIRGSGGGIFKARNLINTNDFFVSNADEVIIPLESNQFAKGLKFHQSSKSICTLFVMDHPEVGTKFGGVWVDSENNVLGFGKEKVSGSVKAFHFVGVFILNSRVMKYINSEEPSNILYDSLMNTLKNNEQVSVFKLNALWFETGNPKDFNDATKKCYEILKNKEDGYYYLDNIIKDTNLGPLENYLLR